VGEYVDQLDPFILSNHILPSQLDRSQDKNYVKTLRMYDTAMNLCRIKLRLT